MVSARFLVLEKIWRRCIPSIATIMARLTYLMFPRHGVLRIAQELKLKYSGIVLRRCSVCHKPFKVWAIVDGDYYIMSCREHNTGFQVIKF